MREILFRGKDIKGNWYEGLLCHNKKKNEWYMKEHGRRSSVDDGV